MTINLDNMSKKELEKLAVQVQKALKTVDVVEKRKALEAAKKAVAQYGYSLAELTQGSGKNAASGKPKRPPKYFNPKDSSQTWSGSGRQPFWFKAAMEEGTDPSKMEI
ncbi:MAG: H-NS histone family protein [Paracoccaceae bacterium]